MNTGGKPAGLEVREGPSGIKLRVYMDNHATTPVDPRVLEEMLPYFTDNFGNAASRNHTFGWAGEEAVETARQRIANLIGATAREIIFTSGATESDNLAIKGVAARYREKGNHIITAVTEHRAVLDSCKHLEKLGCQVTYLGVRQDGLIDLEELKRALDERTYWSRLWRRIMKLAYCNRSRRLASSAVSAVCFFILTRPKRSARYRWM